jgi:hypothetical protein
LPFGTAVVRIVDTPGKLRRLVLAARTDPHVIALPYRSVRQLDGPEPPPATKITRTPTAPSPGRRAAGCRATAAAAISYSGAVGQAAPTYGSAQCSVRNCIRCNN